MSFACAVVTEVVQLPAPIDEAKASKVVVPPVGSVRVSSSARIDLPRLQLLPVHVTVSVVGWVSGAIAPYDAA